MKIKIPLFLVFLVFNSLTLAQTRTGTGPDDTSDDLVQDLLSSINKKSKDCTGEKTNFKNLSEFKLYYGIEESLEKQADPECVAGTIPKKYACIFEGQAKKDLKVIIQNNSHVEMLKTHARINKISDSDLDTITALLYDLNLKLNHEEKK